MRRQLAPAALLAEIHQRIETWPAGRLGQLTADSLDADGRQSLAIKYIPVRYARSYTSAGGALRISGTPGFTWGDGTYVAPLAFPISTAIYGRIGVVAWFQPTGWRVFDATIPDNQQLYMTWAQLQPRARQLLLTIHAALANQFLRNLFRTVFHIDCVLFHPDQRNRWYTAHTDVWMAVSDWAADELVHDGASRHFHDARMTVLVEEEFEPLQHDLRRATLIGPRTQREDNMTAAAKIRAAYAAGDVVHLHA